MNTSPASNPFTGLKGALAGLMSGGWMGLLLSVLFARRIAPMLAALERLFEQFRAGTLPLPAAPLRPAARTPLIGRRAAAPAAPRARRPGPAARRRPAAQAAAAPVRAAAWHPSAAPRLPEASPRAPHPPPSHGRCTKNAEGGARIRTFK